MTAKLQLRAGIAFAALAMPGLPALAQEQPATATVPVVQTLLLCVAAERLGGPLGPMFETREVEVQVTGKAIELARYEGLLAAWLRDKVWPDETVDSFRLRTITAAQDCAASAGNRVRLTAAVTDEVLNQGITIRGSDDFIPDVVKAAARVLGRVAGISATERQVHEFDVHYVTSRHFNTSLPVSQAFGNDVSKTLSFGRVTVRVPHQDTMARVTSDAVVRIERVTALSSVAVKESSLVALAPAAWAQAVGQSAKKSPEHGVLLFVHGYNTSFAGAAMRAAQLAYDLAWPGPVVVYAWPSNHALADYRYDADDALLSADGLADVMQQLAGPGGAPAMAVVAHSMGNRVLLPALKTALQKVSALNSPKLQVVMAAPDVMRDRFNTDFDTFLASTALHVTLYANSNDRALEAAPLVQGLQRLGIGGAHLLERSYIEAVDASDISNAFFGLNHSYFGDNKHVLSDIFRLLRLKQTAAKRVGTSLETHPTRRWSWRVRGP